MRVGRETIRRRLHQLVMALLACALLGAVAMVAGSAINDRTINADPGRAMATVTGKSLLRTTVDYQDVEGVYHSPPGGLLYPTGIGQGQNVWVTYAKTDPDLVKVEGRRWTLSIIPALSVALASVLLAVLLWWLTTWATASARRYRSPRFSEEETRV